MSGPRGRSVRLFLTEGSASGITTAEIVNWTGHVITGSRVGLKALMERSELGRTGVYLLIGPDPADLDALQVYIGEGDVVRKRLASHDNDESKDFWERTCVVTSKDQNITKAHARYLEARLIEIATDSGSVGVANGTEPKLVPLPEADRSDMEFFIEQIQLILPILGFDVLRQYRVAAHELRGSSVHPQGGTPAPEFELTRKKHPAVKARAQVVDGGQFVVLAGSTAAAWRKELEHGYARLQQRLIRSGKLVEGESESLSFAGHVPFASPSAASSVILGRRSNGRTAWKVRGSRKSYRKWQTEQLAAASVSLFDGEDDAG